MAPEATGSQGSAEQPVANLSVAGRLIGPGEPAYIIAEAGVNHDGDVAKARALIDAAADVGADAVKFQTFDPALLVADDAPTAEYQRRAGEQGSQRAMLDRLALPRDAYPPLRDHAAARGLAFLSSPFDEGAVDLLVELGLPALKLPSGELTNLRLLAHAARSGLPLLVSTGMADLAEVVAAVQAMRAAGNTQLGLFHCVSNYPARPDQANLRAIETLRATFGVPTGWSDHTDGVVMSLAAVARGAHLIEKHLTLDRDAPGPDHAASLEPDAFASLVRGARDIEAALGDGTKRPTPPEAEVAAVARKSLHWARDLAAGDVVTEEALRALRPGTGVSPALASALVGRALTRDVRAGAMLRHDDLAD